MRTLTIFIILAFAGIVQAETHVQFNLTDPAFGITQTTGRVVVVQAETKPSSSGNVVLLPYTLRGTTGTNGSVTISNLFGSSISGFYHVTIPAPPLRVDFDIWVQSTNLGLISAASIRGVFGASTYPSSAFAWAADVSDSRYLSITNTAGGVSTNYNFSNSSSNAGVVLWSGTTNVTIGTNYGPAIAAGTNSALAAAQAGDLVVSNALVTTINSKLSTNTQGSWVNVITYGADPWGIADNSALFRLLFSTKTNVLIPPGDYFCATEIIVSNTCNISGYGAVLFNATNTSASSAILKATAPGCKIRGLTFSDERLAYNESAKVIQISAIGFPVVEDVEFWSSAGASITVTGDADIFQRSNHLTLNNLFFDHCYGGVDALSAGQGSQYTTMDNFEGNGGIAYGIKVGAANVRIGSTVIMTGQQGNPTFAGTGLFASFTNVYSHLTCAGQFAHWGSNVVENVSGSQNTAVLMGDIFFSAAANYFRNLNGLKFGAASLVESYGGSYATGCSNSVFTGTDFRGAMTGFAGLIGADCTSNNVALVPNFGSWTNLSALQLGGNPAANFLTNNHAAAVTLNNGLFLTNGFGTLAWGANSDFAALYGLVANTLTIGNNSGVGLSISNNGALTGNGSGLTALNASELTSGTVAPTRMTSTGTNPVASGGIFGLFMTGSGATAVYSNLSGGITLSNLTLVTPTLSGSVLATSAMITNLNRLELPTTGGIDFGAAGSGVTINMNGANLNVNSDLRTASVFPGTDAVRTSGASANRWLGVYSLGYYFASGAGITNAWLTNATLDFPSTASGAFSTLTINLTNASDGDFVTLSVPAAVAQGVTGVFTANATNGYVNVNFNPSTLVTAQDPASGNFRIKVEKVK